MNQHPEQQRTTENEVETSQSSTTGTEDVKKMNVNPNPRANENVDHENVVENADTSGVGSEITDGEGG